MVARHGNFSRAAKALRIAQSAVSRQIRLLEDSLENQLILRTTHSVKLTTLGQSLYEKAAQFDLWSNDTFGKQSITMKIGVLPGLMDEYFTKRMIKAIPEQNLNYVIRVDSPAILDGMLQRNELDACLTNTAMQADHIRSRRLFYENIVIVSCKDIDPSKLETYRWIHMGQATYLKKIAKRESPNFVNVNSMSTLLAFVNAGIGIAAVPDHVLARYPKIKVYPTKIRGGIFLNYWHYDIWPKPLEDLVKLFSPVANQDIR